MPSFDYSSFAHFAEVSNLVSDLILDLISGVYLNLSSVSVWPAHLDLAAAAAAASNADAASSLHVPYQLRFAYSGHT